MSASIFTMILQTKDKEKNEKPTRIFWDSKLQGCRLSKTVSTHASHGMPECMGFGILGGEIIAGINNRLIATAKAMEMTRNTELLLTESIAWKEEAQNSYYATIPVISTVATNFESFGRRFLFLRVYGCVNLLVSGEK